MMQGAEDLANPRCGQTFTLAVEALDRFSNRCSPASHNLPPPRVFPASEEGQLVWDESSWAQAWAATQPVRQSLLANRCFMKNAGCALFPASEEGQLVWGESSWAQVWAATQAVRGLLPMLVVCWFFLLVFFVDCNDLC